MINLAMANEVEKYVPSVFRHISWQLVFNEGSNALELEFSDTHGAQCSPRGHVALCAALEALTLEDENE